MPGSANPRPPPVHPAVWLGNLFGPGPRTQGPGQFAFFIKLIHIKNYVIEFLYIYIIFYIVVVTLWPIVGTP